MLPSNITDAAYNDDHEAIQRWFAPNPDARDSHGKTLLLHAAITGSCKTMRVLLDNAATVDLANRDGRTPLHIAATNGHCTAAALLLDHGAQVEARCYFGRSPLVYAAIYGRYDMIRLLLHRGANVDAPDHKGENAEAMAAHIRDYSDRTRRVFALLKSVRLAGGWRGYLRVPCRRLLGLRILVNQNRAWTEDPLLRRLFPSAPPVEGFKRALADALAKRHVLVDSDALAAAVASALTVHHMELRPAKDAKRPREA